MTVQELINILNNCNKSLPIVVQGYEGGFDDVIGIKETRLILDANSEDYLGHHESAKNDINASIAIWLVSNRR